MQRLAALQARRRLRQRQAGAGEDLADQGRHVAAADAGVAVAHPAVESGSGSGCGVAARSSSGAAAPEVTSAPTARRRVQAAGEAGREVAQEVVGDVADHAAADERGQRPGDVHLGGDVDAGRAVDLGERVDDRRAVAGGSLDRQVLLARGLVGGVDPDRAAVDRRERPDLQRELAVVRAVRRRR